jgi:hypothetical protein
MAKKQNNQGRLQDSLVLFKFMLNLFGCTDLEALSRDLKDPSNEGINDEGETFLYHALVQHLYHSVISKEQLYEYDQNIVRYTREINRKRPDKIQWKYFQYLSMLFTEIYLDRYFSDREKLLEDIRTFHENDFNARQDTWHEVPEFTDGDLNKLAYWCATGSGKTLLMHINIKQYLHYAAKYHAKPLNRVIILTPNEGLSRQHLEELEKSDMAAQLFSKSGGGMFRSQEIEIIDINKLADKDGDKTVAVESFEGNNLVMVDEGHKGSGGDVWKGFRNTLTKDGFSFEYSATFGQAIAAASTPNRKALLEEYGKATLFDYSYRYFYGDGYGKDYRIMNMASWDDGDMFNMYLTAYLLSLYEQTIAYNRDADISRQFLVSKPLGIFVGNSVTAVRTENKRKVSDVIQILLFLQDFIDRKDAYSTYIKRLLDPADGIKNANGYSLFANSFSLSKEGIKEGKELDHAKTVYAGILKVIFNSGISGAKLHVVKQKGGDGEIGLQVGDADYFGVINVGDSDELAKLCLENGLLVDSREFGKMSLFDRINDASSTINILIGSKKFSEGWSSWRVSAMGLMNVGRTEGSEIIQLFGRGVRLKGFQFSLKRSSALDACYNPGAIPKGLRSIETLNIFGVKADYMDAFRNYLKDEGLPANEEVYEQIQIPTVNLLGDKQLKIVRLKKGFDFKKSVTVRPLDAITDISVRLDWTPKVSSLLSNERMAGSGNATLVCHLGEEHLRLLDWERVFFAIEQMKNERSWFNMELSVDILRRIMGKQSWYELIIPEESLKFHDYGRDVARWEDITIALLRAYIDRAYKRLKGRWESQYMETVYLDAKDPNFFDEYTVEVRKDKTAWIERLKELREQIVSGHLEDDFAIEKPWIQAVRFDQHIYYPLLCLTEKDRYGKNVLADKDTDEPLIKISPVALNVGEQKFIKDLRSYYSSHKDDSLKEKDVYLLRNESRKGIGFFEANNFYPDFILWVNDGKTQRVTFIDPKGIRNLRGLRDPKIQLFEQLRKDIQPLLNDPDIILDSYIVSNTEYKDVSFWGEPIDFSDNHVLFQTNTDYIDELFKSILEE